MSQLDMEQQAETASRDEPATATPSQTDLSPHLPKAKKDEFTPAKVAVKTEDPKPAVPVPDPPPETIEETAEQGAEKPAAEKPGAEKAETEEPAKSDEEKVAESKDIMEEVYKGLNVKGKEEASPEVAELIAACIGVLETVEIAVKVEIRREMAQWTEKVSQMTDATKSLEARANEIEAAAKRADEATMKLERASNEEVLETAAQKSEDVKVAVQEMCDDLIERVDVLSEKTENRFERMSRGAYVRIAKKVDRVEAFDAKLDSNMRDAQKQAYAMIKRHEALVKKGEQLLKIPRNFAAVVLMAALAGGALGATIFIAWETLFSKI